MVDYVRDRATDVDEILNKNLCPTIHWDGTFTTDILKLH